MKMLCDHQLGSIGIGEKIKFNFRKFFSEYCLTQYIPANKNVMLTKGIPIYVSPESTREIVLKNNLPKSNTSSCIDRHWS